MSGRPDVDLAIVGAGAAGLGAAHEARALGFTSVTLEAKDRIGGRARTAMLAGIPWDRGAHWLHDARANPFTAMARAWGFRIRSRASSPRLKSGEGWADRKTIEARDAYFRAAFRAIDRAGKAGRDVPAAEVIPGHPRFRDMFRGWCAVVVGTEPEHMSTLDDWRYVEGGANWPVDPGYGAVLARYGEGLDIRLGTAVRAVRVEKNAIALETPRGTLEARAAIVTASTAVLTRGGIAFDPPLPGATMEAIEDLPLGHAEKVAFAFGRNIFGLPPSSHVSFEHQGLETIRFEIRPFGHEIAIGHVGGRFARALEAEGAAAMAAFARDKLAAAFGSAVPAEIRAAATTRWSSDPDIRGGYSCARPGRAEARARLREPVHERLFLAGEAASITAYGTVHGAHDEGRSAVMRAVETLRLVPAAACA